MKRTHYNNGMEVGLKNHGCDECAPCMINGVLCHEHDCPAAWRDHAVECEECGYSFHPKERHMKLCQGCREGFWSDAKDDAWYCDVAGADREFLDY
jgi:hypothetical protein